MTRIKRQLEEIGIETRMEGSEVHLSTTFAGLRRYQESASKLAWRTGHGLAQIKEFTKASPDLDHVDMAAYERQFKRIMGGLKKVETQLKACVPKRTRRFSEYDGEWNYDRQWEIQPFQTATRTMQAGRIVEITAQFNATAGVSTEDLDRYGTIVWSVCRVLETYGVQTGVTWTLPARNIPDYAGCSPRVRIKNPGEYLAPHQLAGVFRGKVFRTLGFMLRAAACDAEGKSWEDCSMGQSRNDIGPGIHFSNGGIQLGPDCLNGFDTYLETAIIDAIKGTNAA